jgi:hypothetical protein
LKLILYVDIDVFKQVLAIYLSARFSFPKGWTVMDSIFSRRIGHVVWAMAATLLVVGCSRGDPNRPKPVPVKGKVLYKGLPVDGASVAFLGDGRLPPALGRTDSKGQFELTTSEAGDGAVPGMHKVTVSKSVASKAAKAAATPISMEDAVKRSKEAKKEDEPLSLLPDRYSQAATSGLSYEVKPTGTNDFTIELKDD